MPDIDSINLRLVGLLQSDFPIEERPFAAMGHRLGIPEADVIKHIVALKESGVVRMISPVLDARKLGFHSTLVAMHIRENRLAEAEKQIAQNPGVSHGYVRDNPFNVWVTLSTPPNANQDSELKKLAADCGAESAVSLPATRVFKLRAHFGPESDAEDAPSASSVPPETATAIPTPQVVSLRDKAVINALQQDLPLVSEPFAPLSAAVSLDIADFMSTVRSLIGRGIIRRYGASVNHRRAGYPANAMACWNVEAPRIDAAGRKIAELPEVSHCYERRPNPSWPYNLFAMFHGHSQEQCTAAILKAADVAGLGEPVVLFSTEELKKTRVRYNL